MDLFNPEPDWNDLRAKALAAEEQLRTGPIEWPGQPSRQRLEFFLAATPDVILTLLDERDRLTSGAEEDSA